MEKTKIDDLARYTFLSSIKHSPDGKYACFIVHEANVEDNKYLSNLWILNLNDNSKYRLTAFDSERSFLWLDSENIVFPAQRDPKDKEKQEAGEEFTQYYKINIHGGEAVKFLMVPKAVSQIKQINDDTYLFTAEYDPREVDLEGLSSEEKEKEKARRKEEEDYEVLDEIPFWLNGAGFTKSKKTSLYLFTASTGKVEKLTSDNTNVDFFALNKAKTKAVILSYYFKDKMPLTNDISIYDFKTKTLKVIPQTVPMSNGYADFISDEKLIIASTDMTSYGVNENAKFYTIDLNSLEQTCITPDFDKALYNSVGSDCRYAGSESTKVEDGYLYFVTTEDDSSLLNRINVNGTIETLTKGNGTVEGVSINGEDILLIAMEANSLQEIYSLKKESLVKLTSFNDWVKSERLVSIPEKISVETEPGVIIDGWVMKPLDFEENKKYPAIFDIHGGPKTVYGTVFFHEMQYWASEGYAVFFCNPRGSDGKGNEFADIRGKYGTIDYDDLMKFTDEVLKRCSFIDPERVGVTGGSYGGFMTNWIIGHTDRFKAAAAQRSISNWTSFFGTTDIGYFFEPDQTAATPWSDYEKVWFHSPLKYADKVKTPTLFLHSDQDYRCWIPEALQMYTALKYHGVDARLCMFKGENHELSRSGKPKHRIRRLTEITEWFNKYLK
ncbi:alpha/beta hydrolase family protein [Clostridium manihotivorum]|uniref:S9 family peptidase n=1 Tax=Clostridium manihotivorum TaxID=2320868 RepID=A0A3R5QR77_9CLOT|nr:S9 family peptidase [Clostridium manihotivorum]QAA30563.1 S9 family peptidase [Clostridium manihotivorum]